MLYVLVMSLLFSFTIFRLERQVPFPSSYCVLIYYISNECVRDGTLASRVTVQLEKWHLRSQYMVQGIKHQQTNFHIIIMYFKMPVLSLVLQFLRREHHSVIFFRHISWSHYFLSGCSL